MQWSRKSTFKKQVEEGTFKNPQFEHSQLIKMLWAMENNIQNQVEGV